jgi:hypothetical protein
MEIPGGGADFSEQQLTNVLGNDLDHTPIVDGKVASSTAVRVGETGKNDAMQRGLQTAETEANYIETLTEAQINGFISEVDKQIPLALKGDLPKEVLQEFLDFALLAGVPPERLQKVLEAKGITVQHKAEHKAEDPDKEAETKPADQTKIPTIEQNEGGVTQPAESIAPTEPVILENPSADDYYQLLRRLNQTIIKAKNSGNKEVHDKLMTVNAYGFSLLFGASSPENADARTAYQRINNILDSL